MVDTRALRFQMRRSEYIVFVSRSEDVVSLFPFATCLIWFTTTNLTSGFKSRFQTDSRVFFAVQLNWLKIKISKSCTSLFVKQLNWYVICMKIYLFLHQFICIFSPFTSKPFIFFIFLP
ncbi:uncharacterized protein LOC114173192 [Vigna unguiculata]|uniref:uncharacterized protein LOC114173192 n=1 Tax=Vigna unguiculata TaxID=3917 RepID=UPI001015E1ED|nr:uncharacterized protein LOC114173192 [Vigna unguiculata]XP_027913249.1 uncharacterized protein LOC114173192 [Vigna unguiculata]